MPGAHAASVKTRTHFFKDKNLSVVLDGSAEGGWTGELDFYCGWRINLARASSVQLPTLEAPAQQESLAMALPIL